jgi:putative ABC transport system ATP-binding protein
MERIKTVNLARSYTNGDTTVTALKDVSLTINDGEFVAITGTSGSGKTTLMQLLGCLDTPTSGDYFIDNVNVAHLSSDELAHIRNTKIGFVFQRYNLLPDLSAIDNVALPRLYNGVAEEQAQQEARELLKLVELEHRAEHHPYEMSGGQQQRVAIARSLINNPAIILADEPTGNLDSATTQAILDLFKKLNQEKNTTIILVTHEDEVANQTKRNIKLKDGVIISDTAVVQK